MLRLILVLTLAAIGVFQSMRSPFYALLFYLWIAYFRPESWVWNGAFVASLSLSFFAGLVLLARTLLSSEKISFGFGPLLMLSFLAHSLLSTIVSPTFDYAWNYWVEFAKTVVICVLIMSLVNTEQRLRATLMMIAFSLGFEAAKQGWAQLILNPGGANQNTIPMLGDNNVVAVGMFMLLPIFVALARTAPKKWEALVERFFAVGVVYRGISTYSRGGFLSAGAFCVHLIARSKHRIAGALGVFLVAALIVPVLPDYFWDRMSTIRSASEDLEAADNSIQGRLHFWRVAAVMANDRPLTGVGHNAFNAVYDRYDFSGGAFGPGRSVHSAWFGVFAELGYPGLLLFVAILVYAFWNCWTADHVARKRADLRPLADYAVAIESCLVVFAVGGTFVIFQYNEMLWHLLALATVVKRVVVKRASEAPPAVITKTPSLERLATHAGAA